jgi:hypothetical protein
LHHFSLEPHYRQGKSDVVVLHDSFSRLLANPWILKLPDYAPAKVALNYHMTSGGFFCSSIFGICMGLTHAKLGSVIIAISEHGMLIERFSITSFCNIMLFGIATSVKVAEKLGGISAIALNLSRNSLKIKLFC